MTKYIPSLNKEPSRLRSIVSVVRHNFEIVDNINNNVSLNIQHRITFANRFSFGLSRQLKSKILSQRTKTKLSDYMVQKYVWWQHQMTRRWKFSKNSWERRISQPIDREAIRNMWLQRQSSANQAKESLCTAFRIDKKTSAWKFFVLVSAYGRGGRLPFRWKAINPVSNVHKRRWTAQCHYHSSIVISMFSSPMTKTSLFRRSETFWYWP